MASSFKGVYNAFDFAYGINGAAAAALQVLNGSLTAGTYTVVAAKSNVASTDGDAIILGTNTPITIGGGINQETVTPTAVSQDSFGNYLITAVFAFAHAIGDTVSSGTSGIAEAVNYAHSKGGGLVAMTTQSGLTSAQINTLALTILGYAGVTLLNYSGTAGALSYHSTGTTTTPAAYTAGIALY
jgi:hypothetical protein